MKRTIIFLTIFISTTVQSQKCGCISKPYLKEIISCKKTTFKNGAEIFWNYDCKSSWIEFKNKNLKKRIFALDENLEELSGRLGFVKWTETKNYFLIMNKVISGCCQPTEILLFDKMNGKKIKKLGTLVFEQDKNENQYFLTMLDLNTLLLFTINDDKTHIIKMPKGRLEETLKLSNDFYAEKYFENIILIKNMFSANYKYLDKNKNWKLAKIKLKL